MSGWSRTPRADTKVFRRSGIVFGFTTSFRMGQLIRYVLDIPEVPAVANRNALDRWLAVDFVDALRTTLKDGGYAKVDNGVETGGTFLMGLQGRLFQIDSDFQVGESRFEFEAVGSGCCEALGALHALRQTRTPPRTRITRALEAAADLNIGVAGPFEIVTVGEPE